MNLIMRLILFNGCNWDRR